MHEHGPSRTAFRVAVRRAAHQIIDRPPVFKDPLALAIIGGDEPAADDNSPTLRAFVAVRSRYAEDQLATAVQHGVRQYVVLGAGLDTFGYRNIHPGLRVFEVDHPSTQAWKRAQLKRMEIEVPAETIFAPVDFERDTLSERLAEAGFRVTESAFFSWLGVVPYLTHAAFTSTLKFVAAMPGGSGVAFDYALERSCLSVVEKVAFDALAARVAAAGEPFQLFFTPPALQPELCALGFQRIEDLDAAEINMRYFHDRADGLKLRGGLAHLLTAWV